MHWVITETFERRNTLGNYALTETRRLDDVMHSGITNKSLHPDPSDCPSDNLHNRPGILYLVQRFAYSRDKKSNVLMDGNETVARAKQRHFINFYARSSIFGVF